MDNPAVYVILDSILLVTLLFATRLRLHASRFFHALPSLRLPKFHHYRLTLIALAFVSVFLLASIWNYSPLHAPASGLGNQQPDSRPGLMQPDSLAQYSGTLTQGGRSSYAIFLIQAHVYDFDLDVLTTNSSVEFELRLYNQFGALIDFTSHNPAVDGISVSLDQYVQSSMNYNITVLSVVGSANYTLWVFDNTVGIPQYSGTFSDPAQHLENYEKSGGDSYLVYFEQFVSYDIQLTNKPAFTDFQLQITDLFGVVINSTKAPAGTDNALDFFWRGLTGNYLVKVVKGNQSPITAAGSYVLGIYRLYVGDIGFNPNNPFYSPQYKKLVANQTGDLYDLYLRQNFAYSFELQGFPSNSDFEIRIVDSLGHVITNSSWAPQGQEVSIGLIWIKNSGTYYLQVFRATGIGNYGLRMWSLSLGSPNTQPIPSYTGNTSPTAKKLLINSNGDYYSVWLDQFVSYDIDLTSKGNTANLQFQIVDIAGKSFYNSSIPVGSDGSADLIWKDNPGYYYIKVFGAASSGPYSLTIWRLYVGDPLQPTSSPSGEGILSSDMGDIYTVYFTQNMAYDINLFPTSNGNMTLQVTDQVNNLIYSNQTVNGKDLSLDFLWTRATGSYFVSILKQAGTGPYRAEFWKMNIPYVSTPTTFTKSFVSQDSNDILAVNLEQNIAYDFELIKPPGAAFDLKLQDLFGTVIASTSSSPGVDVSLNYVNARPAGMYYLKILRSDLSTGQYSLRLWRMDLGSPSTAGTSSFTNKQILANDTGDIYSVYLQQGYSYDVDLQKPSTSNFQIEVRDSFNNLLFGPTRAPIGQDTSLDLIWQNNGYAYLRVVGVNGTGSYSLTIWSMYAGSPGRPTTSPSNKQILSNDTGDTYALYLTNGYAYSFDLYKPWGASLELRLVDGLGVTIAGPTTSPAGQSVSLDLILNQSTGTYYLKVVRMTGSGPYTLKMWGLYLGAPSTPTSVSKDMASNDTGDIYALNLQQGLSYDFNLYKPSGSQLEISLTNASGTIIAGPTSSSSNDIVSLDVILQQPSAPYYLHVLRSSGSGIYTVKLWVLNLGSQGQSPAGEDLAGVDSSDIYTVSLTNGYSYDVDLYKPSNANFEIRLEAANGTVYYTTSSPTGVSVSLDFIWNLQTGTYYIEVLRSLGYGAYTLNFSPLVSIGSPGASTQSYAGSLISGADRMDIWRVVLTMDQPYEFNLINIPSDAHFEFSLTNGTSRVFYNSTTVTGSPASVSFIWRNPSGNYYLRVLRVSGTGSYTLLARSPSIGAPTLTGNTFLNTIYGNDSIATINLQNAEVYDVEMRSLPSDARFGIQLLAPNGTLILQSLPPLGATGGFSFTWNSSTANAYIRITRMAGSGTFTLLAYNNDMGHPGPSPAAALDHYLSERNPAAFFKAQLDANYSYAIVFSSSNLTISILNSTTGKLIAGPFGSGTTIWRANITATYLLLVSKRPGQVSSDLYSLSMGQLSQFTLKIVDPPANGYVGRSFTILIQAQDSAWGVTQVIYQIDGGAWQPTYILSQDYFSAQMSATGLGEGLHTITVRATNGVGGVAIQNREFIVDLSPPTVGLSIPSPSVSVNGLTYVSNRTTLTLNATDQLSGVQTVYYRINGGSWLVYASGFTMPSSDGTYTVEYYATDRAGNPSAVQSKIMTVDDTPPLLSFLSPQSGQTLNSGNVTITWAGSDSSSGIDHFEIKIDSGSFINIGSGTTYATQLSSGKHIVTLLAFDRVGNSESSTLSFSVAALNPFSPSAGNLPLVIGVSLAGVVLLLFLFARRRRRQRESEAIGAGFPETRSV